MSKHAPTPWICGEQFGDNGNSSWIAIIDANGKLLTKDIDEKSAAKIVKRVNEHEALKEQVAELVEALQSVQEEIEKDLDIKNSHRFLPSHPRVGYRALFRINVTIEQALAKHTKGGE